MMALNLAKAGLALLIMLQAVPGLAADAAPSDAPAAVPSDAAFEQRVRDITVELRCLVCQNQTVADSSAPLALDLKQQVRSQLQAGRSPEQIRGYMTERYGDFVLYDPPLKASTLLLWLGPLLLVLAGLGVYWRTLAQRSRAPAPRELSAEERERSARLLQDPSE